MTKADKIIGLIVISFLIFVAIGLISNLTVRSSRSNSEVIHGQGNIGVVEIEGLILKPDRICKEIDKFGKNKRVKAIILKINSPGGGAAASWEVYRKVLEVKEKGKVIISYIGSVGASGAYYISVACNKIIANPSGITGSIGVIADIPVFYKLLNRLGISMETVKSGKYKNIASPYDEFTEDEKQLLQGVIDDLYTQFFQAVYEGRKINKNYLNKIADGRIFTGLQAFKAGLVDTIGTFDDAIELTCKLAGIEGEPRLIYLKKKKVTLLDILLSDIGDVFSRIYFYPRMNYLIKLRGR